MLPTIRPHWASCCIVAVENMSFEGCIIKIRCNTTVRVRLMYEVLLLQTNQNMTKVAGADIETGKIQGVYPAAKR